MADVPALTPRDYDPWRLATPSQLLTCWSVWTSR